MGDMADYYDEREDPLDGYYNPGMEHGRRTPRPRRSNGWNQVNTPPKGTTMPSPKKRQLTPKMRVRQLESELDSNLSLQQQLKQEEERLRADIRRADVPNPPPASAGDMFRVIVQYAGRGPQYTYLLARTGDRWYTTGTQPDRQVFDSWAKLCEWLNSTFWHSHVERLQVTGKTNWPTEFGQEPQF